MKLIARTEPKVWPRRSGYRPMTTPSNGGRRRSVHGKMIEVGKE